MNSQEKAKYRKTHTWKNWRLYLIKKRGNKCEICGLSKKGLQCHHMDEEHYTMLKEDKFAILCRRDHVLIEQLLKRKELDIDAYCAELKRIYLESKNA